jgi:pre-mRNA-processing factor 6
LCVSQSRARAHAKRSRAQPNSVKLWRKTVQLETNPEDVRILLARAVEVVPSSIELWLALARVETPERARAVLNKAQKAIPTAHEIWIAAARLMEQEGGNVDAVMVTAVARLAKNGVQLPRDDWIAEAEKCEASGSIATAQAIVKATVAQGLDEEERLETWLEDAASAVKRGHVETARAVFAYALRVYPQKQSLWRKAAELERVHGTGCVLCVPLKRGYRQ